LAEPWLHEPSVRYLNHGSFGACPRPVLEAQRRVQERMEANPMRFFLRELEAGLDRARAALGALVGARPEDLAFVPNATHAVNAVVRSFPLAPGDELLALDQSYPACLNALAFAAAERGARLCLARVPFPLSSPEEVVAAVRAALSPRTRLALLDHVTSPTGLVLPIARLVAELEGRGVAVLVDGAHALGMLPLALDRLGASYYTANAHKWLCAPKGAAILHARADRQAGLRPLAISHGATARRADRSRFLAEFDWLGTDDPSPYLVLPECVAFLAGLLPGGLPALQARNRALALEARALLLGVLDAPPPCPEEMLGALAAVPLPPAGPASAAPGPLGLDGLQAVLSARGLEVPVFPWPAPPARVLRISAQAYNAPGDYALLASTLGELLAAERGGAP